MTERVWFQQAIEGLFVRSLGDVLTAHHRAQLKSLGLDLSKLVPAYDLATFKAALAVVGPLVSSGGEADQQRELGRRLVTGYFDTFLGAALSKLLALIGPARGLSRIDRSYRSIANHLVARGEDLGGSKARAQFDDIAGLGPFLVGTLESTGRLMGKPSRVTVESDDGQKLSALIDWDG